MRWVAHHHDGTEHEAGPGHAIDRWKLRGISCDGHFVSVPADASFHRLERTSTGKHNWKVGIIEVNEQLHIVWPETSQVLHQVGWGTDVLTGPPREKT